MQQQRHFHVLVRGQYRDKVVQLKDVSHVGATPCGQRVSAKCANVTSADSDCSASGSIDTSQQIQQRCLTATGRAHQCNETPAVNIDIHILQCVNDFFAAAIVLA